jgi:hypothetical protein
MDEVRLVRFSEVKQVEGTSLIDDPAHRAV